MVKGEKAFQLILVQDDFSFFLFLDYVAVWCFCSILK